MIKQPNSHYCFVCGLQNVAGVQVAFYERQMDDGTPEVLARFTLRQIHQGYPGRAHGGVLTGILDETIARAVNFGAGDALPTTWSVTAELNVRFLQPVPLEVELTARGNIVRERRLLFEGAGELYLPDGELAATASGKFMKMDLETIADVDAEGLGWRVYAD